MFGVTGSPLAFKYEAICVLIVANLKTVPPFICLNNSVNGGIVSIFEGFNSIERQKFIHEFSELYKEHTQK
ncbi:hypothetical protein [Butyricicoccus sp.]|uniref:hypothetical protein n=1 Tax=Butyricicoccus sp. TaxID=2049021 RepID=UPI003F18F0DA